MEALTAVAIAGLTLHDMVKAVDPAATLGDIRLLEKTGGKRGHWTRRGRRAADRVRSPPAAAAIVIVSSTRVAAGSAEDRTGPLIVDWLRERGYDDRCAGDLPRRRHRGGDPGCGGRGARAHPDDGRHRRPSRGPHAGGDRRRPRPRAARRRRGDARGRRARDADRRAQPRRRRGRGHHDHRQPARARPAGCATASPCSSRCCRTCSTSSPAATTPSRATRAPMADASFADDHRRSRSTAPRSRRSCAPTPTARSCRSRASSATTITARR